MAIIGTGATAIQAIQEIAKDAGQLSVYQRNPNWCAPLNNGKISKDEMQDIRARYPEILERCKKLLGVIYTQLTQKNFGASQRTDRNFGKIVCKSRLWYLAR